MSDNPPAPSTAEAASSTEAPDPAAGSVGSDDSAIPLRLGFARGIAPTTWARRWEQVTGTELELVPVNVAYGRSDRAVCDVTLERALPGARPAYTEEPGRTRHAIQLYAETLVVVVSRDHDLAEQGTVHLSQLSELPLLDHPQHPAEWPAPQPWADPSWMPGSLNAALDLVSSGAGAIILPTLLARHLVKKREHVLLPLTGAEALPTTTVWASWDIDRDADDVQQLVGVLRGRTARSSRGDTAAAAVAAAAAAASAPARAQDRKQAAKPAGKKAGPKPGSRGAQLAATRKKPPHRGRR